MQGPSPAEGWAVMRKPSALTVMLFLLVLLPSGVLAWLGLRSADAFDASELSRLRSEAEAEAERWRTAKPSPREQVEATIQEVLEYTAAYLAEGFPLSTPEQIAYWMRRARGRMSALGFSIVDMRLVDAAGATIYPVSFDQPPARGDMARPSQAGLVAHLRQKADRAYYSAGGEEAAVAVWVSASERVHAQALRALFDIEVARLRARAGANVAHAEAARLDDAWKEETLVGVGRPAILLWIAAAERGAVWRDRLTRLMGRGVIDATPLTVEERRRVEAGIGDTGAVSGQTTALVGSRSESGVAEFSAGLPGGARLTIRVDRPGLLNLLALSHVGGWGGSPLARFVNRWIEGHHDRPDHAYAFLYKKKPVGDAQRPFLEAAQSVVVVPLPGGVEAPIHLTVNRWREAYKASQERRHWTTVGISLLLLVTVLGLFLIRRAVSREREARRIRDDFIANVTHEVRTPLTSVLLHAEMLIEDGADPAKRKEHAEVVQAQGKRLAALVGDMLDFSALQSGKRTLDVSPVDLAAACEEALAPYRVLAEREGASVSFEEPAGEVAAMADPAALARILANLVGNAWKHGRPSRDNHPGRLRMLATEDARGGVIEVRDDGPGIPAEERGRVFERFGRGRAAIAKEGSGIGLSLARDLARAMGGDLDVLEEGPETVFRVRLAAVPELELE